LWELIRELVGGGTTVLLTTQYLEEADRLADRVAVIDRGRVLSEGTGDQLKDRVGAAVLEVGVPDAERVRVLAALADLDPNPAGVDGRLVVPAPLGVASLQQALDRLADAGITPEHIGLRKPSLDEVFLALTGHTAAHRVAA
jgi:ABC-2 type transport system ATP-binding protein